MDVEMEKEQTKETESTPDMNRSKEDDNMDSESSMQIDTSQADQPVDAIPESNQPNEPQNEEIMEEIQTDALGLLSESRVQETNDSDDEFEDGEDDSPESNQDDEERDEEADMDQPLNDSENFDENDDIDINEDFVLQFEPSDDKDIETDSVKLDESGKTNEISIEESHTPMEVANEPSCKELSPEPLKGKICDEKSTLSKIALATLNQDIDSFLSSLSSKKTDNNQSSPTNEMNTERIQQHVTENIKDLKTFNEPEKDTNIKIEMSPKEQISSTSEAIPDKEVKKTMALSEIQIIDSSDEDESQHAQNKKLKLSNANAKSMDTDENNKNTPKADSVDIVNLDDGSSDNDSEKNMSVINRENSVCIPSSIEITSSNSSTSKISSLGNSGGSVITGLPPSIPKSVSTMKINTSEITISTVNRNSTPLEASVTPVEILNIDSDDEEKNIENEGQKKSWGKHSKTKKRKKASNCINPSCMSKADVELFPCPIYILGMLKIKKIKRDKHPEICVQCQAEIVAYTESLIVKFENGKPLINVAFSTNDDTVEIVDSDSDVEENDNEELVPYSNDFQIDEDNLKFITDNLPEVMERVCKIYDFDNQIKMCSDLLKNGIEKLEVNINDVQKDINILADNTNRMRNEFYSQIKIAREFKEPLDIPYVEEDELILMSSTQPFKRGLENDINSRRSERLRHPKHILPNDEHMPKTFPNITFTEEPADVPPIGVFLPPPLTVGKYVYTVKQSIFGAWVPAIIVNIQSSGTQAGGTTPTFTKLHVKFYTSGNQHTKQVTGRQVAFSEPANVRYEIGARVIALFKDTTLATKKKDTYYSGIISEMPTQENRSRYLVFFDDGYAQYVEHRRILPIVEKSLQVWDDVHVDSRDFVKKYLQSYPERPMVRMLPNQRLKTEKNGSWWDAKVLAIDASLALLRFEGINPREEWIYRGSTRIAILYQQQQAADRRAHTVGRYRPMGALHQQSDNVPYVEYTNEGGGATSNAPETPVNEKQQKPQQRAVAKKSTSSNSNIVPKVETPAPETVNTSGYMFSNIGKVLHYSPKFWIHPLKMIPHNCSERCLNVQSYPLSGLKTYNPLARPLLSGWDREIIKSRYRKSINYRAPCGRRIRNLEELHRYLRLTKSEMSVDLFDFNPKILCLAEYILTKCLVSKADISHGVEAVPVPCVNYFDHSLPEYWTYSTKREPTFGVNLNLDEDFLCACDCVDDCRNKSTCQCWQLTFEGAKYIGYDLHNIGYQYKRLLNQVPTGIYECNSRCKCAATCLNRVVQHPLQLKLQVFKTLNKGWGIRALNWIPKGTFICIYAGNLLTDAVANVDGKAHEGDKYLADLDYIEVVERLKEGYEADIADEDKSDNGSESPNEDDTQGDLNYQLSQNKSDESDDEFHPTSVLLSSKDIKRSLRPRKKRSTSNAPNDQNIENSNLTSSGSNVKSGDFEKLSLNDSADTSHRNESHSQEKKTEGDSITISDDDEVKEPSRFGAPEGFNNDEYVPRHKSVRLLYGSEDCFIMDARVRGNIGRYLNHSCSPNVFVQNVFVDSHDPRFPWVSFFALHHIEAGHELTWNYNYDIGSVPGKVIYCKCGSANCRGRLL